MTSPAAAPSPRRTSRGAPRRRRTAAPDAAGLALFDPVEQDLLRRFFGLKPRLAPELLLATPLGPEEDLEDDEAFLDATRGVRLDPALARDADVPGLQLGEAVARLCLHVVGRRPPVRRDASPFDTLARFAEDDTPRHAPQAPALLFAIDWAMLSWPEHYYAVAVPGFDRTVVLKTSDEECIGGRWLALDWFGPGEDPVEAVGRIVQDWWTLEARLGQERWEAFLEAGAISRGRAGEWADAVWPDEELDPDEDADADEDLDPDDAAEA